MPKYNNAGIEYTSIMLPFANVTFSKISLVIWFWNLGLMWQKLVKPNYAIYWYSYEDDYGVKVLFEYPRGEK